MDKGFWKILISNFHRAALKRLDRKNNRKSNFSLLHDIDLSLVLVARTVLAVLISITVKTSGEVTLFIRRQILVLVALEILICIKFTDNTINAIIHTLKSYKRKTLVFNCQYRPCGYAKNWNKTAMFTSKHFKRIIDEFYKFCYRATLSVGDLARSF